MPGPIPPQAAPQAQAPQQAPEQGGGPTQKLIAETHSTISQLAQAAAKSNPAASEAGGQALAAFEAFVDALTSEAPSQGPATMEAGVAQARPTL
jgi:hypothetical protein